jgi:small subunit ribosomal protein S21
MPQIIPGEDEGIESVLRRFKRAVSRAGLFSDMKKNRFFETPIEKKKRKEIAKHKRKRQKRTFRG